MGRRLKSSFEVEVFDQKLSPQWRLEQFLSVYVSHYSPRHRTETNQLIHYMKEPLPGRRIIYFGLSFEGEPCGFCVLMYYHDQSIGVFDFMVIAPTRRGHGAFFAFAELISAFLERKRIIPNYLVVEVLLDDGPLSHGLTPAILIRLLRYLRFRRVKLPYTAPDPSIVDDLSSCKAVLMMAVEPDRDTIIASEFIRIIELIYLNHYLLWFKPFMEERAGRNYEAAIRTECTRLCQNARSLGMITLNGSRDSDVTLEPVSDRRQVMFAIGGATLAVISIALAFRQEPEITSIVVAIAILAVGLAMFKYRFRRRILSLFDRG